MMSIIVDENGRREVTDAEPEALRVEGDRAFGEFWNALDFRPTAEYDQTTGAAAVLLGDGDQWALGYWGTATADFLDGESDNWRLTWRNLQDSLEGTPIAFEPRHFAMVSDEDVARLAEE